MDGEVTGGSIGSGCETPRIVSGRVVGLRAASGVLLVRFIFVSGSSEQARAIAVASKEAVGKRVAGSFAMARRMTSESAGGILGLISWGGVGINFGLISCLLMLTELSPRNGDTPVHNS